VEQWNSGTVGTEEERKRGTVGTNSNNIRNRGTEDQRISNNSRNRGTLGTEEQ